jgi:hypothetical protein
MFWRYAFIRVQEQDGAVQLAFERHRLKGDKERVLSELLNDLDLHHPPCAKLNANRSFYTLAIPIRIYTSFASSDSLTTGLDS